YTREGDRLTRRTGDDVTTPWWRRRDRWRKGPWSELRLVSAKTYNRVEGLPVHIGSRSGQDFGWGRLLVEGYGIIRSADGFEWKSDNLGHSVSAALQLGKRQGVRLGGRLFNEVEPVESWQLDDSEIGMASFFLHRDFRDYFNRHGGALTANIFGGRDLDLALAYTDERWSTRAARDPWTVFRNTEPWRENPEMDEGTFHLLNATLRYDTRNDQMHPWSGWFMKADYEYGTGTIARYAPTTPGVRESTTRGLTSYDRVLFDVRRYNRVAPDAQLNFRIVAGGWLSGDDLPLQRRFSLGGPGSLSGFDFRSAPSGTDVLQCNTPAIVGSAAPAGTPAECERFAFGQVEFKNDLHFDPFGLFAEDRSWRRSGWGRGTQWVLFGDVGRGWPVGARDGSLTYGKWSIPRLGSFKADVGLGLVLDNVGVYLSKALVKESSPLNVTVRLRPRF
ncbi:MAG: BamA/TamA family outer membrane protein, partial [Gemmatimonadaceae bacterium]